MKVERHLHSKANDDDQHHAIEKYSEPPSEKIFASFLIVEHAAFHRLSK